MTFDSLDHRRSMEATMTRIRRSCWSAAALALLVAASACERRQEPPPEAAEQPAPPAATPSPVPAVDEIAELDTRQQRARESLLRRDYEAAAEELRQIASYLRTQAEGVADDVREGLLTSARDLERVAEDIRRGVSVSARDIDRAVAGARHALARHHLLRAQEARARNAISEAGKELRLAADEMEKGFQSLGEEVASTTAAVARDARSLADRIALGGRWTETEFQQSVDALRREIDRLGERVRR
jgi:hypothetical protein